MTIKNKKIAKRACAVMLSMAMAMPVGIPAMNVKADEPTDISPAPIATDYANAYKDEGYSLVWNDEFDGDSLNLDDWNVEEHAPGWVNAELQAYPDAEGALGKNVIVNDGKLTIKPIATKKESEQGVEGANLLKNPDFSTLHDENEAKWTETIANWGGNDGNAEASSSVKDGKLTYSIANPGNVDWNVQLKQSGINLKKDNTYELSFDALSTETRKIKPCFMSTSYSWYGGGMYDLGKNKETNIKFEFTMNTNDEAADFLISMGQMATDEGELIDTPASDITISNIRLINKTNPYDGLEAYSGYDFTSGRINTENKHNFTYGLFEARARVPKGAGYLPAFWLMAANEDENDEYGVWPTCGEIDMMEVLGDDTSTLHGTIHYGNPHQQNQGKYKITEGSDFYEDYHVFTCEWEPGKITWYVDGKEYYTTSNWYSTKDDGKTLAYPAPFDHDMYVILNLAVGGSWVGYPDEAAMNDMGNQSFDIDYVRVYQKDSYDENVTEPEAPVDESFRTPDEKGNYVLNGDFSTAEALEEDGENDESWVFKTANEGVGSASIADNTMTIKTTNDGKVDYSIQLVQAGLPLIKGKKYSFTFDAKASALRKMQYAIQNTSSWNPYFGAEIIDLTTEYQTFGGEFNVYKPSDKSARIDFNMGAFGSNADIQIKNVQFKLLGDADPEETDDTKYPRADGNRIYNGGFDEGEGRLGYWEINKDDTSTVSVTNENKDGKRVRRLKVEASENVTADNPIVISQEDILLVENRSYNLKLNAEGPVNKTIDVAFGDVNESIELTGEENGINKEVSISVADNKTFSIVIKAPGTYYIDDVFLGVNDKGLIKNGDFGDYGSGWTSYVQSGSGEAGYTYMNGEAQIDIANAGSEDWHVQLNQNNVKLEKGTIYKLSFKAKSNKNRSIKVSLQKNGGDWDKYSGVITADLTNEYKTYTKVFSMEYDTDEATQFNIAAGQIGDAAIEGAHTVWVDDVKLEVVDPETAAEYKAAADEVINLINAIGEVNLTDASKAAIDRASKAYENLKDEEKSFINEESVKKLSDAKAAYADAKAKKDEEENKKVEDKKAADEAIAKINAIPATIDASEATKTAIDAAEKAYNALTDDQKKLVDAATAKKITDAKTAYNAAVEAAKTPVVVEPTPSTGNSNNNGVAEVGETAITEQGTFTATSATTATYTPSEAVKNSADVNIPATANIDGQEVPVTEIPKDAFKDDTAIKNVTVGANIKTIGEGAFQNAKNLTVVKFETKNITAIAKNTFAGATKLKGIDLSKQKNLKTISANAFKGCKKLKTIKIYGNKLTKVNKTAFKGCANKKSVKVTIFAKNKKQYNKVVKMIKKAGLKKVSFKYKKAK